MLGTSTKEDLQTLGKKDIGQDGSLAGPAGVTLCPSRKKNSFTRQDFLLKEQTLKVGEEGKSVQGRAQDAAPGLQKPSQASLYRLSGLRGDHKAARRGTYWEGK